MKVIITFTFCCNNLWKSKFMALEKPGKPREFFLLLCGHPVVDDLLPRMEFARSGKCTVQLHLVIVFLFQVTIVTEPHAGFGSCFDLLLE